LILSGRYDEAPPAQMGVLRNEIAGSEQIMLEESLRHSMGEQRDNFRAAILNFMDRY